MSNSNPIDKPKSGKLPYTSPKLLVHGTAAALTQFWGDDWYNGLGGSQWPKVVDGSDDLVVSMLPGYRA
jgi:hypothetical protein